MSNFNELMQLSKSVLEDFRRERPSISGNPVSNATLEHLSSVEGVDIVDYATACNGIDLAIHHLDEGLPIGQNIRCSQAVLLLEEAVVALKNWMLVKGYSAERHLLSSAIHRTGSASIKMPSALRHSEKPEAVTGQVVTPAEQGVDVITANVFEEDGFRHTRVQKTWICKSLRDGPSALTVIDSATFHSQTQLQSEPVQMGDTPAVQSVAEPKSAMITIRATGVFDYDDPSTWKFRVGISPSGEGGLTNEKATPETGY